MQACLSRVGCSDPGLERSVRHWILKQTQFKFHPQDPAHGLINPRLWNGAFLNQCDQMIAETVIERHHAHVDAGHYGHSRCFLFSGRDAPNGDKLLYVLPVGHNKSVETQFIAQYVGQNMMVNVPGNAIDLR